VPRQEEPAAVQAESWPLELMVKTRSAGAENEMAMEGPLRETSVPSWVTMEVVAATASLWSPTISM
jgi:hypothetical protein